MNAQTQHLTLRMRPDLIVSRHAFQGRAGRVVKDPLALKYFRFDEEEYAILELVDGRSTLAEIKDRFHRRFPGCEIADGELAQLLTSFKRAGLFASDEPGQGRQLFQEFRERRRTAWRSKLKNILLIRFKGVDPEPLLTRLYPLVRWMFSRAAVTICALIAFCAVCLVAVQTEKFRSRLPGFDDFFGLQNAAWIALAIAIAKITHELAHGTTCKHYGGESHEMGILIMCLTPCLYVNVSDSWMLPSKWQRIAVMAAGMYIEIVIASLCTFVWWFTEPGILNAICLRLIFICSVTTLLFNANPLMRYDGYYILCDWLEIPNLRQRAAEALNQKLAAWFFGIPPRSNAFGLTRHQGLFALYAVLSTAYRWMLSFTIAWILVRLLAPHRLQSIGYVYAATALFGLLGRPAFRLVRFVLDPGRRMMIRRKSVLRTSAVLAALIVGFFCVPLPSSIVCPVEVLHDAAAVYVSVPGTLRSVHVQPGQSVEAGTPLATLENIEPRARFAEMSSRRDRLRTQLEGLRRAQYQDPSATQQIPHIVGMIEALDQQIARAREFIDQLTLVAPTGGTVLAPPLVPQHPSTDGELPRWDGSPLDPENTGCHLDPGMLYCLVGDPKRFQAKITIDQHDRALVRSGDDVELKLDQLPDVTLVGSVDDPSLEDVRKRDSEVALPASESHEIAAARLKSQGITGAAFTARVFLTDGDGLIRAGVRGRAKIRVGPQTLAQRTWRMIHATFRFRS